MKLNPALRTLIASAAALALVSCATFRAEDAESILRRADLAMGGTGLKTIRYAGSGTGGIFGQAYRAGMPWPKINHPSYSQLADYENSALREEIARSRAEPTGGGALPLMGMGEQRTTGLLRGTDAWNMVGPAPVPAPVALHCARTVEVHTIEGSVHSQGFLMVYLPSEKLLIEADAYTPGPPKAAPPAEPNDNHVNLVQNIERLKLSVERILPLHGRIASLTELYAAIGRQP